MTRTEVIAKTKILLGEIAADSMRNKEATPEFVAKLEAMRDTIKAAIERCLEETTTA